MVFLYLESLQLKCKRELWDEVVVGIERYFETECHRHVGCLTVHICGNLFPCPRPGPQLATSPSRSLLRNRRNTFFSHAPYPSQYLTDVCLRTPCIGKKRYWKIGGRSVYSSPPALPVLQMASMLKNSAIVRFHCLLIPVRSYTW